MSKKRNAAAQALPLPEIDVSSAEPLQVFTVSAGGVATAQQRKAMSEFYDAHQVLLVRKATVSAKRPNTKAHDPLSVLAEKWAAMPTSHKEVLRQSWTVENEGSGSIACPKNPDELFGSDASKSSLRKKGSQFYVSCIAQREAGLLQSINSMIPYPLDLSGAPCPPFMLHGATQSAPTWLFLGVNESEEDLEGRPEHTDVVGHSGTWHYQLAGVKRWCIRPDEENEGWKGGAGPPQLTESKSAKRRRGKGDPLRLCIECGPGDVLVINTKLWRHHTQIPPTSTSQFGLSLSLAKDFHIQGEKKKKKEEEEEGAEAKAEAEEYTNIEGIYATNDVKKGEIVLRESELPDCSLPRSLNANCEVALVEDAFGNEEYCLIARSRIRKGDFLAVLPSDDEEDEEEEEEEEEEGEDE
jgi:hypothetical protein